MRAYTVLLKITEKDNCISAGVSEVAADTCFKSKECNLGQFLFFLSLTGTLPHPEPIEVLELHIDVGSP